MFFIKNKKFLYLSLLIILLINSLSIWLIFFHNNNTKEEDKKNDNIKESTITPLLYEVTKEGSNNKIYLFGSIHAADDRANPLPKTVLTAYDQSDYLAVEFDLIAYSYDFKAQSNTLQKLMCEDGKTLKDVMHADTYNLLNTYLSENGLYNSIYEYYRPVFFYSLMSNKITEKANLDSNKGIDMYFLKRARKEKKEILEVESAEYQYNLLSNLPDELFDLMIKFYILNEETSIKNIKDLYEAWISGDKEKIIQSTNEETELTEDFDEYTDIEKMLEDYKNKLIYKRNLEMTDKVDGYFQDNKKVFVVVGTAHIIGEDAMIDLLTEKGYKVNKIEYNNNN